MIMHPITFLIELIVLKIINYFCLFLFETLSSPFCTSQHSAVTIERMKSPE